MSNFMSEALEKLEREYKGGKYDRYAAVMKQDVKNTIADFCRQDDEFAQAVAQGGHFEDCMKAVAKGCSGGISDMTAYTRAVQFYFPGAEIRMQMTVDLAGAAGKQDDYIPKHADEGQKGIMLDFTQFL